MYERVKEYHDRVLNAWGRLSWILSAVDKEKKVFGTLSINICSVG